MSTFSFVEAVMKDDIFRSYCFYNGLLIVKMMAMSLLTGRQRFKNKAFANPEDSKGMGVKPMVNQDVERVRRYTVTIFKNTPIQKHSKNHKIS